MTSTYDTLPPWAPTFCARLAASGIVSRAAQETGVHASTAYQLRKASPAFAQLWDEALETAYDELEGEMRRRALEGVDTPVFHQGEEVARVRKYSDTLAMFLMKGYRRRRFGDGLALTGEGGGPVQIDEGTRAARIAQLLAAAQARADGQPQADGEGPAAEGDDGAPW